MPKAISLKVIALSTSVFLTIGYNTNSHAADVCDKIYSTPNQRVALQQLAISKGVSQLLRSNALHFWQWISSFSDLFFSKDILNIKGFVVGDPHNGNFAPTLINNKMKWVSVDYDDGGKNIPLILDFVRYLASVKSVTDDVRSKDLWEAYLSGLQGHPKDPPDFVQELLDMSPAQYRKLQHKKALKNSVEQNGIRQLVVDDVENFKIEDTQERQTIQNKFQTLLTNMKVLDVVGRQKDRGGSKDAARYLALAQRDPANPNSELVLYEMKQKLDSAVDEYEMQPEDNFASVIDFFVGKDVNYQQVKITTKKNGQSQTDIFLFRPKQLYLLEVTNDASNKKELQKFKNLSEYNAWYIGHQQHLQAAGKQLQNTLENKDLDVVLMNVKAMVKQYLDLLEEALKKKKD